MNMSFPYSNWMRLPINTRHKIAETFGIKKVGPTHVANNEILADGYDYKDLEKVLTVPTLQSFMHSTETDFTVLWGWLIDLMEGRTPEVPIPPDSVIQVMPDQVIDNEATIEEPVKKPRVSKVKKNVKAKKSK